VPAARAREVLAGAEAKAAKEATQSLEEWEKAHRARVEEILRQKRFAG
jgi:4-hydroxy-4-methyl-2-oxoglutarate aldolase